MQRRAFLKSAGVATVLVAGGGVWRAYNCGVFSVGQGPAFEPWRDWQQTKSGPLALVRAAILAASPGVGCFSHSLSFSPSYYSRNTRSSAQNCRDTWIQHL